MTDIDYPPCPSVFGYFPELPRPPGPFGGPIPRRDAVGRQVSRAIASHKPCAVAECPYDAVAYGKLCAVHDRGLK